jgi:flagellar motor component MotA
MPHYDDLIKEEAMALYLQGLGYRKIASKIREQYSNKVVNTTIRAWSEAGKWPTILEEQRKVIRSKTTQSTTKSVTQYIKTLRAVQSKFVSQLDAEHTEIKANEMVNVIRMLLHLEGAKDVKDTLVKEIAEQLPEAMKRAKIPQKKINTTIKIWVEMVRDMA